MANAWPRSRALRSSGINGKRSTLVAAPFFGGALDPGAIGWGAVAGVVSGLAVWWFYLALAGGPMSIVSPLTAVLVAGLPVLIGMLMGERPGSLQEVARPPYFIPEGKKVDELLTELRQTKVHIAIVVDEYGGTAGIVTVEDLLEEIVGEIEDEYDTEVEMVQDLSTDAEVAYRLDGRVSMDDLRDLFDLSDDDEPDEDAYDTVGGFVVHRVGRIPLPRAEVAFRDGVRIVVETAEPRRVAKVVASQPRPPGENGNGEEAAEGD